MNYNKCKVKANKNFKLSDIDTRAGEKYPDSEKLMLKLQSDIEEIANLQNKLFAENSQSLLIILQGMDSAGKDGTIKHVMRGGINPQGVNVVSFKHPTALEFDHDYLWRHAIKLPEHGQITIFNRSHYENVLISKVHPEIVLAERLPSIKNIKEIDKKFWNKRYKQINYFEKMNIENGTTILKFFLHLSKEEQGKRFLDRIEQKEKHWKFSSADITERKFWHSYQDAYEQAFINTSKKKSPWYIIPADDKLYTHLLIGGIILKELKKMNPSFPPENKKEKMLMQKAKEELKKID
jgi:PPK2 family polyphosphate:nucleotide phosphotransferase